MELGSRPQETLTQHLLDKLLCLLMASVHHLVSRNAHGDTRIVERPLPVLLSCGSIRNCYPLIYQPISVASVPLYTSSMDGLLHFPRFSEIPQGLSDLVARSQLLSLVESYVPILQ